MNLLERYIFRRTFALSLITLAATTLMVLVTQVLLYVNLLTASGQALLAFFALAATLIPPMVNLVLPFALSHRGEPDAERHELRFRAGGNRFPGGLLWVQTKPILLLALAMSLTALAISHFAEPWAERSKREILAKARADLIRFAVQSGTFQQLAPGLFVQIGQQLPSGRI